MPGESHHSFTLLSHPFSDSPLRCLLQLPSLAASPAGGAPQVLMDHGPYPDSSDSPLAFPQCLLCSSRWELSVAAGRPSIYEIQHPIFNEEGCVTFCRTSAYPEMISFYGFQSKPGHCCSLERLLELNSFNVALHQMEGTTLY